MTPEEIQQTIEGMLAIQRELQNSQLEFRESLVQLRIDIADLKESTRNLNEISQRHERRIEQLLGYSITGEGDRLDLLQRLMTLERRVSRLEQEDHGVS
jgi:hypothetical protein